MKFILDWCGLKMSGWTPEEKEILAGVMRSAEELNARLSWKGDPEEIIGTLCEYMRGVLVVERWYHRQGFREGSDIHRHDLVGVLVDPTEEALHGAYGVEIELQRAFPNDDFAFRYVNRTGFSVDDGVSLQQRGFRLYMPMALDDVPYVIY